MCHVSPVMCHVLPVTCQNIPGAVNERLSNISSNEEVFKEAAKDYQGPLNEAGYKYELNFNPTTNNNRQQQKKPKKINYLL